MHNAINLVFTRLLIMQHHGGIRGGIMQRESEIV